jgi:hypothetical protein
MAKQRISDVDFIEALNGLDATGYQRMSSSGQETLDAFFDKAEKGIKQRDLDKMVGSDGQHYFDILKNAKL